MSIQRTKFVVENFTNSIGQVLKPGDPVVYVGSGYNHSVKINTGVFEGVYKGGYWRKPDDVSAIRIGNVPGRRYKYDYDTGKGEYKDIIRKAILPLARAFKVETALTAVASAI